jgi:hypothetical protein
MFGKPSGAYCHYFQEVYSENGFQEWMWMANVDIAAALLSCRGLLLGIYLVDCDRPFSKVIVSVYIIAE